MIPQVSSDNRREVTEIILLAGIKREGEKNMIIKGDAKIHDLTGLTDEEKARVRDFLQGAVYCWCKNRKDEWFGMADLMGGDNNDWEGTPLIRLYENQKEGGKTHEEARERAGIDSGWLLKAVIHGDLRRFETEETPVKRQYRWVRQQG
jgi:hypothetical protein